MRIWKFIVPSDRFYPLTSHPELEYKGCLAVVVAETEAEARTQLAEEEGADRMRWLEIAKVKSFRVDTPAVIASAMV